MAGRKRDFGQVVINGIIGIETPGLQATIEIHPLRIGQHNDELLAIRPADTVRPLHVFDGRHVDAGELALGHPARNGGGGAPEQALAYAGATHGSARHRSAVAERQQCAGPAPALAVGVGELGLADGRRVERGRRRAGDIPIDHLPGLPIQKYSIRHARRGPQPGNTQNGRPEIGLRRRALNVFVVAQEVIRLVAQHHVAGRQVPVGVGEGDVDFIELLQLLGVAFGLKRHVLVRYSSREVNIFSQLTFQL